MFLFFFFSSRRRHTRYIGDWSSDVCSSDLRTMGMARDRNSRRARACQKSASRDQNAQRRERTSATAEGEAVAGDAVTRIRSEERRVGKECRSRWWKEQ